MFINHLFNLYLVAVLIVVISLTACVPSAQSNPSDRFAGTWSGTMSFSDDANRKEDIIVTIPAGCVEGDVCGDLNNITVRCTWEMTLDTINGDAFAYKFSKTMSGECPALGGGTLTGSPMVHSSVNTKRQISLPAEHCYPGSTPDWLNHLERGLMWITGPLSTPRSNWDWLGTRVS